MSDFFEPDVAEPTAAATVDSFEPDPPVHETAVGKFVTESSQPGSPDWSSGIDKPMRAESIQPLGPILLGAVFGEGQESGAAPKMSKEQMEARRTQYHLMIDEETKDNLLPAVGIGGPFAREEHKAAFKHSPVGRIYQFATGNRIHVEAQPDPAHMTTTEWLQSSFSRNFVPLLFDLPFIALGGKFGGEAGSAASGALERQAAKMGGEAVIGQGFRATAYRGVVEALPAIGASYGGWGGPAMLRHAFADAIEKGEVQDFGEFAERSAGYFNTFLHEGTIGAATTGAGKAAPKYRKVAAEIATLAELNALSNNQILPSKQEFADAAFTLGGMHAGMSVAKGLGKLGDMTPAQHAAITDRLINIFRETGIPPASLVEASLHDPSLRARLVYENTRDIPEQAQRRVMDFRNGRFINPAEVKISPLRYIDLGEQLRPAQLYEMGLPPRFIEEYAARVEEHLRGQALDKDVAGQLGKLIDPDTPLPAEEFARQLEEMHEESVYQPSPPKSRAELVREGQTADWERRQAGLPEEALPKLDIGEAQREEIAKLRGEGEQKLQPPIMTPDERPADYPPSGELFYDMYTGKLVKADEMNSSQFISIPDSVFWGEAANRPSWMGDALWEHGRAELYRGKGPTPPEQLPVDLLLDAEHIRATLDYLIGGEELPASITADIFEKISGGQAIKMEGLTLDEIMKMDSLPSEIKQRDSDKALSREKWLKQKLHNLLDVTLYQAKPVHTEMTRIHERAQELETNLKKTLAALYEGKELTDAYKESIIRRTLFKDLEYAKEHLTDGEQALLDAHFGVYEAFREAVRNEYRQARLSTGESVFDVEAQRVLQAKQTKREGDISKLEKDYETAYREFLWSAEELGPAPETVTTRQLLKRVGDLGTRLNKLRDAPPFTLEQIREEVINREINKLFSRDEFSPLRRNEGDYVVVGKTNGKVWHSEAFATRAEAKEAEAELKRQFPSAVHPGVDIYAFDSKIQYGRSWRNISFDVLYDFEALAKKMKLNEEGAAELKSVVAAIMATKGARGAFAQRVGVSGFSFDPVKSGFQYAEAVPLAILRKLHGEKLEAAIDSLPPDRQQWARDTVDYWLGRGDREAQWSYVARSIIYNWYLGAKPAFGVTNYLQRFTNTIPHAQALDGLRGIRAGIANEALEKQLVGKYLDWSRYQPQDGTVDFVKFLRQTDTGMAPEKVATLIRLFERGQIEAFRAHEIVGEGGKMGKINDFLGYIANQSERSNRLHAGLTFADIGIRRGLTRDALYEFVRDQVKLTQHDYSGFNRPEIGRGSTAATLYTFKSYALYQFNFLRNLAGLNKGAFLTSLAVQFGLFGAGGVFGAAQFWSVINFAAGKVWGDDWELKKQEVKDGMMAKHPFLTRLFGGGLAAPALGIDYSSTGNANIWDMPAAVSLVKDTYEGLKKVSDPNLDWRQWAKRVSPLELKHLLGDDFVRDLEGKKKISEAKLQNIHPTIRARAAEIYNKMPLEMTPAERLFYALGFVSKSQSEFRDALYAINDADRKIKERAKDMNLAFAKAYEQNDAAKMAVLEQQAARHNIKLSAPSIGQSVEGLGDVRPRPGVAAPLLPDAWEED